MSIKKRKRLIYRWMRNNHCHWCGKPTVLIIRPAGIKNPPSFPSEATIDHLRSKNVGRVHVTDGSFQTVLSCWQCNNDRNKEEVSSLDKELLWEKSKSFPLHHEKAKCPYRSAWMRDEVRSFARNDEWYASRYYRHYVKNKN